MLGYMCNAGIDLAFKNKKLMFYQQKFLFLYYILWWVFKTEI